MTATRTFFALFVTGIGRLISVQEGVQPVASGLPSALRRTILHATPQETNATARGDRPGWVRTRGSAILLNDRTEPTAGKGRYLMANDQNIRVAIIGLGFGAEFIPIYQNYPGVEAYAICRRS